MNRGWNPTAQIPDTSPSSVAVAGRCRRELALLYGNGQEVWLCLGREQAGKGSDGQTRDVGRCCKLLQRATFPACQPPRHARHVPFAVASHWLAGRTPSGVSARAHTGRPGEDTPDASSCLETASRGSWLVVDRIGISLLRTVTLILLLTGFCRMVGLPWSWRIFFCNKNHAMMFDALICAEHHLGRETLDKEVRDQQNREPLSICHGQRSITR